jgi:hypothetical protein
LILDALADAPDAQGDPAQLQGLVEICEALDIRPMSPDEVTMASSARVEDLCRVADLASVSLYTQTRIPPSGSDEHFTWRRYHQLTADTYIAVGIRRPNTGRDASAGGWTWMRVHATTGAAGRRGKGAHRAVADRVHRRRGTHLGPPTGPDGRVRLRHHRRRRRPGGGGDVDDPDRAGLIRSGVIGYRVRFPASGLPSSLFGPYA